MRKLILTTAAVAAAIAGAFAAEPSFGTFTDTRDGQKYKTVKIGKQTWMAENLNYKTEWGTWCYKNDTSHCKKYGRLYDWEVAMEACPAGYHLPSREEWDNLAESVGGKKSPIDYDFNHTWKLAGKKLKAKKGWNMYEDKSGNGTDDYGFSALPSGDHNTANGRFNRIGDNGTWWTATQVRNGEGYGRGMYYNGDGVYEIHGKAQAFSVRCVADSP
jgi:uncharacterized protein (TIGR02145 family)